MLLVTEVGNLRMKNLNLESVYFCCTANIWYMNATGVFQESVLVHRTFFYPTSTKNNMLLVTESGNLWSKRIVLHA